MFTSVETDCAAFALWRRRGRHGFTLAEVVAVMALIVIFAGAVGFAFMRGGGQSSVGLQAAQSTVSSLITLVRSQAAVSGRNAALFVNVNAGNPVRYLRFLVPAVRDESGAWVPLNQGVSLPPGCYLVSESPPSGDEIEPDADWVNLHSTALNPSTTETLMATTSETWTFTEFTPRGTPTFGSSGRIVIANGRPNPPGYPKPFVFTNPQNVRGVSISVYGAVRLINENAGFQP